MFVTVHFCSFTAAENVRKKTFVGNRAAGKKPLPSIFFGQDEM
jgi:hypothetical protein